MTSDCHVSFAFQLHYKFKRVVISRSVECLVFRIHHNGGVLFPFIGFDVKTNSLSITDYSNNSEFEVKRGNMSLTM